MCASVGKAGSGVIDCVCVSGEGGEWSGSLSVRQCGRREVEWLTVCVSGEGGEWSYCLCVRQWGMLEVEWLTVCVSGEGGEWSG